MRSSGVKNRAFAGESGKNNLFKLFKKGHSGRLVRSSSAQRKKTRRRGEDEVACDAQEEDASDNRNTAEDDVQPSDGQMHGRWACEVSIVI